VPTGFRTASLPVTSQPPRPSWTGVGLGLLAVAITVRSLGAEAVTPSADSRFAVEKVDETPSFQRHVAPLLGRLGCNSRSCHGSFQGRGGFRLSLFGYDFQQDHTALTEQKGDEGQLRVDVREPEASLILLKPILVRDHEGGRRFAEDSWQYRLLHRWVEAGARRESPQRLQHLEVQPREIVFAEAGQTAKLQVVATWDDGTREDVTCLCRFQVNDDGVAAIDGDGQVKALTAGDTHVVAFYDNGTAVTDVLLPYRPASAPLPAAASRIDQLIQQKLEKLGLDISPLSGDTEFLRRVRIDLTGTLPSPDEVRTFLADTTAGKRSRKIDELLNSPEYAAWWANRFCDYWGNHPQRQGDGQVGQQVADQWYHWVRARLEENTPYDQLVARVMLANGRESSTTSYAEYAAEMSSYFRENETADFSRRETMPHYWARSNLQKPEDRAIDVAHAFLGLRLHCAQCHKHPYDRWTQQDFQGFANLLRGVRYGVAPDSAEDYQRLAKAVGIGSPPAQGANVTRELIDQAQQGRTIPFREVYAENTVTGEQVVILGERQPVGEAGADPRQVIYEWIRREDNAYFVAAIVNRVWAAYFHRGLVDPPDDLNAANPASHRQLLDELCRGFVDHGYDLKWLHRQIANSETYQRTWRPTGNNANDSRNYSHSIARRLPAEVVYDALAQSSAADDQIEQVRHDLTRRAIGRLSLLMTGTYAMRVFGKPDRLVACDCERNDEITLLQFVFLQNDPLVYQRLDQSGWLKRVQDRAAQQQLQTEEQRAGVVEEAYLRTLNRLPDDAERQRALDYLRDEPNPADGARDLLWALWNTKEFLLR
jgi:hypothetical protein